MRFFNSLFLQAVCLTALLGSTQAHAQIEPVPEDPAFDKARAQAVQYEFGAFTGAAGITIRYAKSTVEAAQGTVVISAGRTEGFFKYREMTAHFNDAGYSVWIPDHRGQGASDRLFGHCNDTWDAQCEIGYIDNFQYYIDDLKTFIDDHVQIQGELVIAAHSMGGGIASGYLLQNPNGPVAGAVMSSPMHGLRSAGLIRFGSWVLRLFGQDSQYLPGSGPHNPEGSGVVHSEGECCSRSVQRKQFVGREELEYFADALGRPSVGLGGVSPRWLRLSVEATEEIVSNAARASQPILILSAGEESLVSNDQQTAFCTTAPNCQRVEISGALHELYIESDEYRNQALTCVDEFLKALTVSGTQTSRCIDPEALGL